MSEQTEALPAKTNAGVKTPPRRQNRIIVSVDQKTNSAALAKPGRGLIEALKDVTADVLLPSRR